MHKLNTVIRHEYLTIIRQPSFWIAMVAFPLLFAGIFALNYISNQSSSNRIDELSKSLQDVAVVDESSLISQEVVASYSLTLHPAEDKEELRQSVQDGGTEALIVYPESIAEDKSYDIYLKSTDFTVSSGVDSLADSILETSLYLPLGDPSIIALAQNGAQSHQVTYDNGQETAGINEYVVPGFLLLLFFVIFLFSVGYMLSSVSEEKENRSMEMVLTYVNPRYLIVGKLLAVTLVTLTQLIFIAALSLAALGVAHLMGSTITLPAGIDLSEIVFDPVKIAFGLSFVIVGFLLYAGFMTIVAAASPSSKEANNFSAIFYMAPWVPIWFLMSILTDPENRTVQFLSYFPLTSPVVALLRNMIGNMSLIESALVLAVMVGFMVLTIALAVRTFSRGALEFSKTISFTSLFKK